MSRIRSAGRSVPGILIDLAFLVLDWTLAFTLGVVLGAISALFFSSPSAPRRRQPPRSDL